MLTSPCPPCRLDQERWSYESDELDRESREREHQEFKQRALAPLLSRFQLAPMAGAFGGGELGRKIAALVVEVQNDLLPGTLSAESPVPPPPAASIQVNPTQSK